MFLPFEIEFAYKNENFAETFLYFILLLLPGESPSSMMGEKILDSSQTKNFFSLMFYIKIGYFVLYWTLQDTKIFTKSF